MLYTHTPLSILAKPLKMITPSRFLFLSLFAFCFTSLALGGASQLPEDEVQALKDIAKTLDKKDWDFNTNPCSGPSWTNPSFGQQNNVSCDCSVPNDNFCHVVSIILAGQNLQGRLPPELIRLPYLQKIWLSSNYLSGTIPKEWGSMNLVEINLFGNRLNGSIPVEIANISTLQTFRLDLNYLTGTIPKEWGSMNLVNISLYGNQLTGSIPAEIANISTLQTLDLGNNNLSGNLPPELGNLTRLEYLDLRWNYLNGTIPKEWGSMNLVTIYLTGNRLTGSIPAEIANISTLQTLYLGNNNLSGNLPPELGNLTRLEYLSLQSNNFTGELPKTFLRLTTLKSVRLGDNQFSGSIPNFIQRWTSLQTLVIQGSGFSGPIPKGISFLQNLAYLVISDLNGPDSTFPPLKNMKSLDTLILRSCNINDTLPEYLGDLTTLITLDLSYNKLRGGIPGTFERLKEVNYIYLTGNLLTGPVPKWTATATSIDLSYNNFSNKNPEPMTCLEPNMNLFASFAKRNDSGPLSCGKAKDSCPKIFYSFHINCGGTKVMIGGTTYDDDTRPTISKTGGENWAFSITGHDIIENNHSRLYVPDSEAELYMNARVSPISLTYYGFCLANGNYTVKLHFAEIVFTDDNTFNSLGRRVFDVYIQGEQVLKNFNIKSEAQGVGKALTRTFSANVSSNDLEIRFYWAGKGTTVGSLISAISVTSDFSPPSKIISTRVVVGIVVAALVIVILIVNLLWLRGCLGKRNSLAKELKDLELQTGLFTLRQIKAATNNFDIANMIGEGGFGPVYKGTLLDGTTIAVKQLSSKSKQGNREFINEIGMISALQHPHLVKLYGCCVDGDQLLLVYEYMENNSLARALFGPDAARLKLNWATRHKICVGIARGLAFLHEESRLKIVHRDIKATNVLLDKDLNPKISDFGLAKLSEEDNTHISTRIAGTYGYMAPEYAMHGYLTDKADVYSFGIVALEIVSGVTNTIHRPKGEALYLLNWAHLLKEKGHLMELVDPRLGSDFNEEEAMVMIKVALLSTNVTSNLRPSMSSVVSMLEGRIVSPEFVPNSSEVMDEIKLEIMRQYYNQVDETKISETQTQSQRLLMDGPWTASSSSTTDLYPAKLGSSNWEKRN